MTKICPFISAIERRYLPCIGKGCMMCKTSPMGRVVCAISGEKIDKEAHQ